LLKRKNYEEWEPEPGRSLHRDGRQPLSANRPGL
jgi:hypothetical protein